MTRYPMLRNSRVIPNPQQWPLLRHQLPIHRVKRPTSIPFTRHHTASYTNNPHPQYRLPKYNLNQSKPDKDLSTVTRLNAQGFKSTCPSFLSPSKAPQPLTSRYRPLLIHYSRLQFNSKFRSHYSTMTTPGSNNSASEPYPKYNWIDGAESLEKYRPGGYHPVMIGDLLHDRYRIVDKLGYGGYSTVWLARDTHLERYVAVKVGIANSLPHETKVLRALSVPTSVPSSVRAGLNSIPIPLDEFEVTGPNGTHPCYTTTPARCNLREVSFSRLFPLDVARALLGGLILAVAYMHSQGYVHGGKLRVNPLIPAIQVNA